MKGLLLKNCYTIFKYCKIIIFLDIIFLLFSLYSDSTIPFLLYPCMLTATLPVTVIAYEEKEGWNFYAGTLPLSKRELVLEKYLLTLILGSVIVLLVMLTQPLKLLVHENFYLVDYAFLIILSIPAILLPPAIFLPLIFKFGVEKGRIFYLLFIGAFCSIFGIGISLVESFPNTVFKKEYLPLMLLALILIVILYALSLLLSIAIYKKREF